MEILQGTHCNNIKAYVHAIHYWLKITRMNEKHLPYNNNNNKLAPCGMIKVFLN